MNKYPEIKVVKTLTEDQIQENDYALVIDGQELDIDNKIVYPVMDEYIDEVETLASLFCSEDLKHIINVYELCKDCDNFYIVDEDLRKAWAVGLLLYLYNSPTLKRAEQLRSMLYDYAVRQPSVPPEASAIIAEIDYYLELDGTLLDITDEYLATGKLVKLGAIYKATWF